MPDRIRLTADGELEVQAAAPLRERFSWALYDFSNTIFSMNIVTLYFAVWVATDLGAGTAGYALATSISSLAVAVFAPVAGAFSDRSRRRKSWVVGLTLLCVVATAVLGAIGGGRPSVPLVLAVFVVANFAYQGAQPFYNAMMPELVPAGERGRLSGYATALGYVGSIAGMLMIAPFVSGALPLLGPLPEGVVSTLRRLPFTHEGGRAAAFVPTALLFLLFSLPLFAWCRDHVPLPRAHWSPRAFVAPFRELWDAVVRTRKYPGLARFVLASLVYHDVIGTVIAFMAVYTVAVMGFAQGSEVTLFVVLTVPSIAGSALFGLLSDRIGPKRTLGIVLVSWTVLLVAIAAAQSRAMFWAVGAGVGFVFGGIWAVERPMLLSLVPDAEAGRFFGLLALSARAAAIVGPLIWALTVEVVLASQPPTVSYRVAIGSLAVLAGLAVWLLSGVPDRGTVGTGDRGIGT